MKQFKLKEKKSFIKILKEPPLKKTKTNWSRRIYLAIFMIVFFLFAQRIYNANMIIFANGQIELPKQTVKFPTDIKVLDLNIVEGDRVCQGDTLFSFQFMGDEVNQSRLNISTPESSNWIIKEQLTVQKKIDINNALIHQKNENLIYISEQLNLKKELLLAGIHSEYKMFSDLQDMLIKIQSEILLFKREIGILKNHLARLNKHEKENSILNFTQFQALNETKYFVAPIDGVISDIFYETNEICYKKEEMITIHQLTNSSINTYFDPEEINHIEVGDIVFIEFPDKSKSKGVISKFFVSTYAVPSEFQKKYEPTERNIVAQVVPLNKEDELYWNSYYKMEVTIQKKRYNFNM